MNRRQIEALRGPKNILNPWKPYAYLYEEEPGEDLALVPTATIFLTNRECPYRCVFCDLWKNTLDARVPAGAIPAQIEFALTSLAESPSQPSTQSPLSQIKLYNAGSFFDPNAIPPEDYAAIAELLQPFKRVIVECHPAFVGNRCFEFMDMLPGRLEVAMGLETANPEVLGRLNKGMTLDSFMKAADDLSEKAISLRTFILLKPPHLNESEAVEWAFRSLDFAFDCGSKVCSVIPTRAGNGAMDTLQQSGEFAPPRLQSLEVVIEYGLGKRLGRVFADLWDVERFHSCDCSPARSERLALMNRTQQHQPPIHCDRGCG